MKKNLKKRKITLIVLVIILIVGTYFIYHGYYLHKYKETMSYESIKSAQREILYSEIMTIQSQKLKDDEYLHFNGLLLENSLKDFKEEHPNWGKYSDQTYILLDEDGNQKERFMIERNKNIYLDSNRLLHLYPEENEKQELEKFYQSLQKKKIKNGVDAFQYIKSYKYVPTTIFTPVSRMKENNFFENLLAMSSYQAAKYFEKDLIGFIVKSEESFIIRLYNKDDEFLLVFPKGDIFTEEYILEILKTLKYENN